MFSKSFLIILGSLVGIVVIAVFLILPAWQDITNLRQEFVSDNNLLGIKQKLLSQIKSLADKFQRSQDKVTKIDLAIPRDQSITKLLVQFESIAAENGMILNSVNFSEQTSAGVPGRREDSETERSAYKILSINENLKGSYSSFKNFLKAVEEDMRLMDIQSISFSSSGEENSLFNFTVGINAYWQ